MEKIIKEQESLDLITQMINQAKNSFDKKAEQSLLVWGYGVSIVALLNFVLLYILPEPTISYNVWWLMFVVKLIAVVLERKKRKESVVKNHMDRVISATWNAFLYGILLMGLMVVVYCFATNSNIFTFVITPIILVMMGGGLYITSVASRSREYLFGSVIFWIAAVIVVLFIALKLPNFQFLVLSLATILGFIIPVYKTDK